MRMIQVIAILAAVLPSAVSAQETPGQAVLNELNAAPIAKKQSDLDTTQLASAHRDRAASAEEKTNGLWQSWVVAICQGCGVRERQHSRKDVDELVARSAAQTKPTPTTQTPVARMPVAPRIVRPLDTLEGRGPGVTTGSIRQVSHDSALD